MEDVKDIDLHNFSEDLGDSIDALDSHNGVNFTTKYPGSKRPLNKAKRRSKGKIQRQSRKINQKKR